MQLDTAIVDKEEFYAKVIKHASELMKVSEYDIISEGRMDDVAHARILVCAILRANRFKVVEIGEIIGRDHSSVTYCEKQFNKIIKNSRHRYFNQFITVSTSIAVQQKEITLKAIESKINSLKKNIEMLEKRKQEIVAQ